MSGEMMNAEWGVVLLTFGYALGWIRATLWLNKHNRR